MSQNVTNGLKLDRSFYPPSLNIAFYFIANLRRRRSANGTQPNFAKWYRHKIAQTIYRNSVRVDPSTKLQKVYTFGRLFDVFEILMANIFRMKHETIWQGCQNYDRSLTPSQNFMNFGPQSGNGKEIEHTVTLTGVGCVNL